MPKKTISKAKNQPMQTQRVKMSKTAPKPEQKARQEYKPIQLDLLAPFGKNRILPIGNPTGMPISNKDMLKMPSPQELRGLQVKAELNKLGPAPPSYARLLEMSVEAAADKMEIDTTDNSERQLIRDRFEKIEKAKPSIHPSLLRAQ